MATAEKIEVFAPPEVQERRANASDLCSDFMNICDLERQAAGKWLNIPAHKLMPAYLAQHLKPEQAGIVVDKLDLIFASEQNRHLISHYAGTSHASELLKDERTRDYVIRLAHTGMVAAYIDEILDKKSDRINGTDMRAYKTRLVEAHGEYVRLADSEFGRSLGFTRNHLGSLLRSAYGSAENGSTLMADWAESGIAAEVGTKRCMERVLQGREGETTQVRYASGEEDLTGGDVIYQNGRNKLYIDIKSSDKNGIGDEYEPRAHHTPIEEVDLGVYKIRQLYPANNRAIGNDFEVTAPSYQREIEKVVDEFDNLVSLRV